LAELYADQGMYAQSLSALGHLMILQTWDSDAVRRAAETAYTMGYVGQSPDVLQRAELTRSDYQLALKHFLRTTEMETDPSYPSANKTSTRTWWGIKLVCLTFDLGSPALIQVK
jgi:hypothetical protein